MTVEYNKIIKHLERLVTKGKRLLTLMQICRKYETQEEKIIPFAYSVEVENSSRKVSVLSDLDRQVISTFQNTRQKSRAIFKSAS